MKRIKFLLPVINFYLIGLIILSVSRILLAIAFNGRVLETDNVTDSSYNLIALN